MFVGRFRWNFVNVLLVASNQYVPVALRRAKSYRWISRIPHNRSPKLFMIELVARLQDTTVKMRKWRRNLLRLFLAAMGTLVFWTSYNYSSVFLSDKSSRERLTVVIAQRDKVFSPNFGRTSPPGGLALSDRRDRRERPQTDLRARSVDNATEVCQKILLYGVTHVNSGTLKECVSYVLEYPSAWRELFDKIESYLVWHKTARQQIQTKLKVNRDIEAALHGIRTLTYYCKKWPHCAGYGDQAQKTARGFLLAMLSGRFFTVEWSPNFEGSDKWVEVLTPTELNWKMDPPLSLKLLEPEPCRSCAFGKGKFINAYGKQASRDHLFYYVLNPQDVLCGKQNGIDMEPQHVAYFCKEAIKDHYVEQPNRIFFIYGIIHRLMYRFSDGVIQRGERRLRELGLAYKPYVAVHIRTALEETTAVKMKYFLNIGRFQRGSTHWKLFINCGRMAASEGGFKTPLLLFSDSPKCLKWAAATYSSNEVVASNSSFWHNAEHGSLPESKENVNKIIDTMSDLYLISKATVVVKGVSLFSNLGMYLGAVSNGNVVRCDLEPKVHGTLTK